MMTEYKLTKEAVKTLQRVITLKATIEVERLEKLVKICLPPHYEVRDDNDETLRTASRARCAEKSFLTNRPVELSSNTQLLLAQLETVRGEQEVFFG